MTAERPDDVEAAAIEFMAALKKYMNALIEAALARHDSEAAKTPAPFRARRWIYFIQGEDGGPIKIGIANDPAKRLATLQRTSPVKLQIIAQRRGEMFDEKGLHEKFAEHRLHGEWFEPVDAILDEVEAA